MLVTSGSKYLRICPLRNWHACIQQMAQPRLIHGRPLSSVAVIHTVSLHALAGLAVERTRSPTAQCNIPASIVRRFARSVIGLIITLTRMHARTASLRSRPSGSPSASAMQKDRVLNEYVSPDAGWPQRLTHAIALVKHVHARHSLTQRLPFARQRMDSLAARVPVSSNREGVFCNYAHFLAHSLPYSLAPARAPEVA